MEVIILYQNEFDATYVVKTKENDVVKVHFEYNLQYPYTIYCTQCGYGECEHSQAVLEFLCELTEEEE